MAFNRMIMALCFLFKEDVPAVTLRKDKEILDSNLPRVERKKFKKPKIMPFGITWLLGHLKVSL